MNSLLKNNIQYARNIKQFLVVLISTMLLIGSISQSHAALFGSSDDPAKKHPLPKLEAPQIGKVKVVWRANEMRPKDLDGKMIPFPAQINGQDLLFTASSREQVVVARNAKTGKVVWRHSTKLDITSGPFVTGDKLFVGSANGTVLALDVNTGRKLWEKSVSSEVIAVPRGDANSILVNAMDGKLTALNALNGEIKWVYDRAIPALVLREGSSPLVIDNKGYAGFSNGKVVSFDIETGGTRWEKLISTPKGYSEIQRMVDICADLVTDQNSLYVISHQGQMTALNLDTGNNIWQRELNSRHNFVLENNLLYVTDSNNVVWALDAATGATLWKQNLLEHRNLTGPQVYKDFVILTDSQGYLFWLRKDSGQLVGMYRLGGEGYKFAPVVANDILYVLSHSGQLTALKLDNI